MKKEFSTSWIASRQVRKQRKYRENAPLHIRHKFMSANLSKELRKKIGKRSLPARKGDTVKVMAGKFKKKTGKVGKVDLKRLRISIDGVQRQKKDGTKINVYFNPSKLQIIEIYEDRRRKTSKIEKNKEVKKVEEEKIEEKVEEKNAPKKK